jgi:hypothetical protein
LGLGRQRELDDVVEATEEGTIQHLGVIGRGENDAVRIILLKELQERIHHPPDLTNIVPGRALPANRVELIEEVDASGCPYRVEDELQLRGRFAQELRHQGLEHDLEERQVKLARDDGRTQCLARARRTDEQHSMARAQPMRPELLSLTLFVKEPVDTAPKLGRDHEFVQGHLRVRRSKQSTQLASGLREGDRSFNPILLGAVDDLAKLASQPDVALPGFKGGDLHGNRQEARLVSLRMALDKGFDLLGSGHGVPSYYSTVAP